MYINNFIVQHLAHFENFERDMEGASKYAFHKPV